MNRTNMLFVFSKNLKKARKIKRFTQNFVCYNLRLKMRMYAYYEAGICLPNLNTFRKLCEFLDVSPQVLLGMRAPKKFSSGF